MNLTSSILALASQNLSSTHLQDIGGYSYCQEFYGLFPKSRDCVKATGLLEKGTSEFSYAVHSGIGPHALPLTKRYGTCMIQVDLAGPRLPRTYDIIPDDIRALADVVLESCVAGPSKIGGFATSDLQVMSGWITAEETKLDRPFPTSTAFLTVTLTNVVPDWLSPGNYDPIMAFHFSSVVLAAIERAFTLREKVNLRQRAERLLRQGERMRPRGSRISWWERPSLGGKINGTSLEIGNGTAPIDLPGPLASGIDTATSKRRRRT